MRRLFLAPSSCIRCSLTTHNSVTHLFLRDFWHAAARRWVAACFFCARWCGAGQDVVMWGSSCCGLWSDSGSFGASVAVHESVSAAAWWYFLALAVSRSFMLWYTENSLLWSVFLCLAVLFSLIGRVRSSEWAAEKLCIGAWNATIDAVIRYLLTRHS